MLDLGEPQARVRAWREDIEKGTLPFQAISDPELHRDELKRIFGRAWQALGFESEIGKPGDYILRYMGEDQVIVSRAEDGNIHVMLNNCRHRGTWLCEQEKGNTKTFRCPYHGWVYRNDGSWAGAPMRSKAYQNLKPEDWGLLKAAKVETRWGLIFATLDPDAPSFEDYLGDFKFHADAFFNLDSRGYRLLSEPSRWRAKSNWKSNPENVIGDAYHVSTLHASAVTIGMAPPMAPLQEHFAMFHGSNGHGMITWSLEDAGMFPKGSHPWAYPDHVWNDFDKKDLSDEQLDFLKKYTPLSMVIFPNLSFARLFTRHPETGEQLVWSWMRICQPNGPGEHISWNFFTNLNAESEENGVHALHAGLQWLGAAGIGDIDDAMTWEGASQAANSVFAQMRGMQANYQMGVGDMSAAYDLPDWTGPGVAKRTSYTEDNQRAFYAEWLRRMDDEAAE